MPRSLLIPALFAAACGPKAPPVPPVPAAPVRPMITVEGEALGGLVRIDIRCPSAERAEECTAAGTAAIVEIQRIGAIADDWTNPEGDLSRINAAAGEAPVKVGPDTLRMVTAAQTVAAASAGAFDITVGALSGLWDVPGASLPSPETIQERLGLVDWTQVSLKDDQIGLGKPGMAIVLGGVIKGDAADRALAVIPADMDARIDVATDFVVRGEWEVTVPLPGATPRVATFKVRDTALVTSGTWVASNSPGEGYFKQVVDARSGAKASGAAVSVVAHPRGVIADALSTTLRVTGDQTSAADVLGAWAVVFDADGKATEVGRRGAIVMDWSSAAIKPPAPAAPAAPVAPAAPEESAPPAN